MPATTPTAPPDAHHFLASQHPYDAMAKSELALLASKFQLRSFAGGEVIYQAGQPQEGLYLIHHGHVEVLDENGAPLSLLSVRNTFGERGLVKEGLAVTTARALEPTTLFLLPAAEFTALLKRSPVAKRFFDRTRSRTEERGVGQSRVADLMSVNPVSCNPETRIQDAAKQIRQARVASLCVTEGGALCGIVTVRDLTAALADALPLDTPVAKVMTPDPMTLPPSALGSDVLHAMMEYRVGHIPICDGERLVGIVSQTDLTRFQAVSSGELVSEVAHSETAAEMAGVTARIPQLLAQLVGAGLRHEVVTRLITDVADTVTRRLLALAEAKFGPPPVPYVWLACGSQGRQEQTGVSDQDNCMILSDEVTEAQMVYFRDLAQFVSDGLHICGYVYCPGDMMATNSQWCQPRSVWKDYFQGWIHKPDPMAQMLASVMFDLRVIGGEAALFSDLQEETLEVAGRNSIFVAHMVGNSLKHTPPLGLLRGLATIRSGEHKDQIDMKHNGVVPVVDLARVYALQGGTVAVNTRARLDAAERAGILSPTGARDLIDAYDQIAEARLLHQAKQIRGGVAPDNFMAPSELSDLERSHLRNAFVVVKGLQSALGHGNPGMG